MGAWCSGAGWELGSADLGRSRKGTANWRAARLNLHAHSGLWAWWLMAGFWPNASSWPFLRCRGWYQEACLFAKARLSCCTPPGTSKAHLCIHGERQGLLRREWNVISDQLRKLLYYTRLILNDQLHCERALTVTSKSPRFFPRKEERKKAPSSWNKAKTQ